MVNANIASARDLGNHGTKSGNEVKSVAQSKKITGTVVDAAGVPIIGANVIVVGTTNGSITDMDGKFVIEDVAEGAKLKVSSLKKEHCNSIGFHFYCGLLFMFCGTLPINVYNFLKTGVKHIIPGRIA